jgi:signal transduction histidine kinase
MEDLERTDNARDLQRIRSAGHHLLSLVNNILDLSKIEANKLEVAYGPVDLEALAADIETTAQPLVNSKLVQFETEVEPGIGAITSDVLRIKQCLLNLVGNAAKFTNTGRIQFVIHSYGDDAVVFNVSDTGIGIAAHQVEHLFEEFNQGDHAPNTRQQGTGLGLAITRKLARLLGGDVTVKSELGVGSTFSLVLPRTPREN